MALRLIICSKSTWTPAIRREHALALQAAGEGVEVAFLERPIDIRSLRNAPGRRSWIEAARRGLVRTPAPGVQVFGRATVAPAHRSNAALLLDALLLERSIRAIQGWREATVVATLPWHWPAVARVAARRRVLDYTDDWEALIPGSEATVRRLLRRAERQADAITVVSDDLKGLFSPGAATVVRNGVSQALVDPPLEPPPGRSRIVYVGTLSDRFDVPLIEATLPRLAPSWTVDLYGPCQYPHHGDRPSSELRSLLEDPRVNWRGPIERDRVAGTLDGADVLVIPHRRIRPGADGASPSWRGDVMKLYDYAARGRAIVSTRYVDHLAETGPPALYLADDGAGFAAAIERAADVRAPALAAQHAWAAEHTWGQRWQAWKAATGFP